MADEGSKFVFKRLQLTPKSPIKEAHSIEDRLRMQKVADRTWDRYLRVGFAAGIFVILLLELIAVICFLAAGVAPVSEATVGVLVAATLTQTWAILRIVAQYLFPNRDGKGEDDSPK